jgi:hypothetical protein
MKNEGPLLETLTRRLAECPAEFLYEPRLGKEGTVRVAAVVADLLCSLGAPDLQGATLGAAVEAQGVPGPARGAAGKRPDAASPDPAQHRNRLQMVLIGAWLLHDPWFRSGGQLAPAAYRFLAQDLAELAGLVNAGRLVSDPDRREELARLCLKTLGLRPAGETPAQAQDRLQTLSTLERQRVIREAQAAEVRMREIREAMKKKAAEEAAAKFRRE